ncbi:alpha/beta fold hydrolase [Kitasatospora mediocidica]|uniref:alpha/beta fold hydrolase n=1 Tax=Kitasatospora mediocidica TaxID=58352 RepID=UPI000560D31C|nr:alpha/beta fold hydrolase [Kitasatospora mediocidica]
MQRPTLAARRVATSRLTVNILERKGSSEGEPVLLLHGNVSAAPFWHRTVVDLPAGYRPIAPDLRGFGDSDPLPVDATRGLSDYSDDLSALLDALGLDRVHLVGWSLGGGVALRQLRDHAPRLRSVTLVNPVSPYGFGGTHGIDGRLNHPDGAGSGAGTANPEFVRLLAAGERAADSPLAPRAVLEACYVKRTLDPAAVDDYVGAMLSTRIGDDHYPGDSRTSQAWPGIAPGDRGVLNCLAPTHFRIDDLEAAQAKPPVLWVRGAEDVIVSDTSLFDLAHLGALGAVPGWPGSHACPAQPMVSQTRAILDRYAAAGGSVREVVFEGVGHSPHLECPQEFVAELTAVLRSGR